MMGSRFYLQLLLNPNISLLSLLPTQESGALHLCRTDTEPCMSMNKVYAIFCMCACMIRAHVYDVCMYISTWPSAFLVHTFGVFWGAGRLLFDL